jgi:hypothetical protein
LLSSFRDQICKWPETWSALKLFTGLELLVPEALKQTPKILFILLGTPKDRGLIAWREQMELVSDREKADLPSTYDFPVGMKFLRRYGLWQLLVSP